VIEQRGFNPRRPGPLLLATRRDAGVN